MCGIIGYVGFQDPKDILLDGLRRLEYRGYDSAGIAVMENAQVKVCRSEGRIAQLEQKLLNTCFTGTIGIGHTRWATHGAPSETNAHPHKVGSITLVHNGIIENYMELKAELLLKRRKIASDTDSEIVAHLFDLEVASGKTLEESIFAVLPMLRGSYAFVIMSDREKDGIVSVRNGAPLLVGLGAKENFVASDVQAILHRTNKFIFLEDNQFAVCRREGVEIKDLKGKAVDFRIQAIEWTPDQLEKSGYKHYMHKEIHEQAQALAKTIATNVIQQDGILRLTALENKPEFLEGIRRICIVACGTARHAGLIGQYYIERFAGLPVDVDFGSEFRYRRRVLDKETLLVLISQSGETADTLAAQREGAQRGLRTLAICNVRDSSLTRVSDATIYTSAGPEIGVASTKAFTTQLSVLYMLGVELGVRNGTLNRPAAVELTRDLMELPVLVDRAMSVEGEIARIATELQSFSFFFFLGRDVNYPIALEGSLKLKEISYVHSEGIPAGEIKHGPLALVDKSTAVIMLAPTDQPSQLDDRKVFSETSEIISEKLMSNLQEIKSRHGQIFTIGTDGESRFASQSGFHVSLPKAPWALQPILLSVPLQLLAYHMALQRGMDVDKPRNLAKSVTVE